MYLIYFYLLYFSIIFSYYIHFSTYPIIFNIARLGYTSIFSAIILMKISLDRACGGKLNQREKE